MSSIRNEVVEALKRKHYSYSIMWCVHMFRGPIHLGFEKELRDTEDECRFSYETLCGAPVPESFIVMGSSWSPFPFSSFDDLIDRILKYRGQCEVRHDPVKCKRCDKIALKIGFYDLDNKLRKIGLRD